MIIPDLPNWPFQLQKVLKDGEIFFWVLAQGIAIFQIN